VRFGATVTVREPEGTETRYRIVGVDEIDLDRQWVSWLSPLARGLLNARIGDRVVHRTPRGPRELTVLQIEFES
jgi:transcription elongation factor GreB